MKKYKVIEYNIEYDITEYTTGGKSWFKNGVLHRAGGPAIEYANGFKLYFYEGKQIKVTSDEEFIKYIKLKEFW